MRSSLVEISPPQAVQTDSGAWRVTATVGEQEVFFEADAPLAPSAEAFLSAFLLPAMSRRMNLRMAAPVCPVWLENIESIRTIARDWWKYSGGKILHEGNERRTQRPEWGLFFGGGVDSFATLQREQERLSYLIYIEGYDVPLDDPVRIKGVLKWNRAVAEETGKKLITVRTNLRGHRLLHSIHWETAFGSALAAVGHLLREVCGTFLLSAGFSIPESFPHGSHCQLDPLWSSSAIRVVHHGGDMTRREKAEAIASYPPAQKYLRVCWEHRKAELNCGECEKCVRTQLEFLTSGNLERMTTVPGGSLCARIDALPHTEERLYFFYNEMLDHINDPDVRRSIEALMARSREWHSPKPWYRRLFRRRRKRNA